MTDAMRERVRYLAGVGVPQDDIAKIIGCAPKTLRKRFRDDLDRGVAEANATMCGYLFASAKAGNIAAIIFWVKTRAWRERMTPDRPIPGVDPASNSQIILILPDNNRDPELDRGALRRRRNRWFVDSPREEDGLEPLVPVRWAGVWSCFLPLRRFPFPPKGPTLSRPGTEDFESHRRASGAKPILLPDARTHL